MEAKCGKEKNSDAVVSVCLGGTGIEIEIISRIKTLFGKQMEAAVREVCQRLDVADAKILVHDYGALDFVIKARIKTAIKMARKQVQ